MQMKKEKHTQYSRTDCVKRTRCELSVRVERLRFYGQGVFLRHIEWTTN